MTVKPKYGCGDYRNEMTLLNLRRRLQDDNLSEEEADDIKACIEELEKELGLD